jgi:UDP-glucose 4-epimerase
MRTLRRSILAIATNTIARIKAIVEYVSVPTTNTLKEMKLRENYYNNNTYQSDQLVQKLSKHRIELYLLVFATSTYYFQQQ